ncbi:MAG TPA: hypothetical protein VGC99_19220 [Candidatus Tectomicrobia bacterium]
MKRLTLIMTGLMFVGMSTLASANPAMLPEHPGYPARGEFANDTGQQNLTYAQSMQDAARSGDAIIVQNLEDLSTVSLRKSQGAGQLSLVQGVPLSIESPVRVDTRIHAKQSLPPCDDYPRSVDTRLHAKP